MKQTKFKLMAVFFAAFILISTPLGAFSNTILCPNSPIAGVMGPVEEEDAPGVPSLPQMSELENKTEVFTNDPEITFTTNYDEDIVQLNVSILNNLATSISMFELFIRVNKSDVAEHIILTDSYLLNAQDKMTLSTYDENDVTMLFIIKLVEGDILIPGEVVDATLTWFDDNPLMKAQWNVPGLIENGYSDDIEAVFHCSDRVEEAQLFPLIEKHYWKEETTETVCHMDFIITNLMEAPLTDFNFTFMKSNPILIESYRDYSIDGGDLDGGELALIDYYAEYDDRHIKFDFSVSGMSLLANESFVIQTSWADSELNSRDVIYWNFGEHDQWNMAKPFYHVAYEFYTLLSPVEPISNKDFDFDGIRNDVELATEGFDPFVENAWVHWTTLRSDYDLEAAQCKKLELLGEVQIVVPVNDSDKELVMHVKEIGGFDKLLNVMVNGEEDFPLINTAGYYSIDNPAQEGVYDISFLLLHDSNYGDSNYEIVFLLDGVEVYDVSEFLMMDSDGDMVFDFYEPDHALIPDRDLDGAIDGRDMSPDHAMTFSYGVDPGSPDERDELYAPDNDYIHYFHSPIFKYAFPIKTSGGSIVEIQLQVKPTEHDYTTERHYADTSVYVYPAVRVFNMSLGGEDLPDNAVSPDGGQSGVVGFAPLKYAFNDQTYGWSTTLQYTTSDARTDGKINLAFVLCWVIYKFNHRTGEAQLKQAYENPEDFTIQGIKVTESRETVVTVAAVDDGDDRMKTEKYAELVAHAKASEMTYAEGDISMKSGPCTDAWDLNETRDGLRQELADENPALSVEDSVFVLITTKLTSGYGFDYLSEYIAGNGYSSTSWWDKEGLAWQELEHFFSDDRTCYTGFCGIQILQGDRLDYFKDFTFIISTGLYDTTDQTIYMGITWSKTTYCGWTCNELLILESEDYWSAYYGYEESADGVWAHEFGGLFEQYLALKDWVENIYYKPHYVLMLMPAWARWYSFWVWGMIGQKLESQRSWLKLFFQAGFGAGWIAIKLVLKIFDSVSCMFKFLSGLDTFLSTVGKVMAVLQIIVGILMIGYGICQYMSGLKATGLTNIIKGALMVLAGCLILFGGPWGAAIGAIIGLILLADTIFGMIFGKGFIQLFVEWLGFEDVNPQYEMLYQTLSIPALAKLRFQGGFRVGDEIMLESEWDNYGNTDVIIESWLIAGGTKDDISQGDYASLTLPDPGNPGDPSNFELGDIKHETGFCNTRDAFSTASPISQITIGWQITIWHDAPKHFSIPCCFSTSGTCVSGCYRDPAPEMYGPQDTWNTTTLEIAVLPDNVEDYIVLLFSGFEDYYLPEVETINVDNQIDPTGNKEAEYLLEITNNDNKAHTYVLEAVNTQHQTYVVDGVETNAVNLYINSGATKTVSVVMTLEDSHTIAAGSYIAEFEVSDIYANNPNLVSYATLNYDIIAKRGIEVVSNIPLTQVGDPDQTLSFGVKVKNTGNIMDQYQVIVSGLDELLYFVRSEDLMLDMNDEAWFSLNYRIPYDRPYDAGVYEFDLTVKSMSDAAVFEAYELTYEVPEYFKTKVEPYGYERVGLLEDILIYELTVWNYGNVPQNYDMANTAIPNAASVVYSQDTILSLAPFESVSLTATITPSELGHTQFNVTASNLDVTGKAELMLHVVDEPGSPSKEVITTINDNNVFISWVREPEIAYYMVYISDEPFTEDDLDDMDYRITYYNHYYDKDLNNGTYYYAVRGYSIWGYVGNVSEVFAMNVTVFLIMPEYVEPPVVSDYLTLMLVMLGVIVGVVGALALASKQTGGRKFWEDENLVKFSKDIKKLKIKPEKILKKPKLEVEVPEEISFSKELTAQEAELLEKVRIAEEVKIEKAKTIVQETYTINDLLSEEELEFINEFEVSEQEHIKDVSNVIAQEKKVHFANLWKESGVKKDEPTEEDDFADGELEELESLNLNKENKKLDFKDLWKKNLDN